MNVNIQELLALIGMKEVEIMQLKNALIEAKKALEEVKKEPPKK